jgi:hypothetical protein
VTAEGREEKAKGKERKRGLLLATKIRTRQKRKYYDPHKNTLIHKNDNNDMACMDCKLHQYAGVAGCLL